MEKFLMLPNKLVWDSNGHETYLKKYGDKILHILSYLDGVTNRFGKSVFCLKEIIEKAGMKPKTGKKKVNEQFKIILSKLEDEGIIEADDDYDFSKIKLNDYISCIFRMPIEQENNRNTKFFKVSFDNYLKIIESYNGTLNKLTLLKIYYYINARISRRENIVVDDKKLNINDINIHGGKANCFYDSYINICDDLEISENTWCEYIDELQKMGLIFFDNIGNVRKNNNTYTANNVYCIDKSELDEALEQSKMYYMEEGYVILGKKTQQELRKINGLKGKIKQEQNRNKDTSKLDKKLENLQNSGKIKPKKKREKSFKPKDKPIKQENISEKDEARINGLNEFEAIQKTTPFDKNYKNLDWQEETWTDDLPY